jgi:hypothetical protein
MRAMKTMTMGEYYVWYCEWCDSRNLTPWTQATTGTVRCGCCHKEFPVTGARRSESSSQPRHAFL